MMRDPIDPAEERTLLKLARSEAALALGLSNAPSPIPAIAGRFGGLFVTFWHGTKLRGCIGTLEPVEDLAGAVSRVTRSALTDGRFVKDPIVPAELSELRIELSLLSDPQPTKEPLRLVPGTHGLIVRKGALSGCFLPKVAADRGWTAEETLRHCCEMKAGLPGDAWRDPATEVLLFTAETITEGEPELCG